MKVLGLSVAVQRPQVRNMCCRESCSACFGTKGLMGSQGENTEL